VGRARRPPDHRGRLRRRAVPRARRRAAGSRPRPRPLHRLGEQATDAGDAPGLDAATVVAVVGPDLREGDRGRGLGDRRPARPRRLHRPRRARAPPAAHAYATHSAARLCWPRSRASSPTGVPTKAAVGCTCSPSYPTTWTSRPCWRPPLVTASASRASHSTATPGTVRPVSCWGTPTWPSPRSSVACDCSSTRSAQRRWQVALEISYPRGTTGSETTATPPS
jgi:hypothetical protein